MIDLITETAEARLVRLASVVLTETALLPFLGQIAVVEVCTDDPGVIAVTFTLNDAQRGRGWFEVPMAVAYVQDADVSDADIVTFLHDALTAQTEVLKEMHAMKPDEYFVSFAEAAFNAYGEEAKWRTWDDKPMPLWNEVGANIQARWIAATKAIFKKLDVRDDETGERVV